jgi:hypothetical protein
MNVVVVAESPVSETLRFRFAHIFNVDHSGFLVCDHVLF